MNQGCTCPSDKCLSELLERPRYFPRQLVSDAEMNLEQLYFRNKLRLHNRMLHGWGVVCGAIVCRVPARPDGANGECDNGEKDCAGFKPWKVVVRRGYILGPYGDEIVIGCDHEVDLRSFGISGISGECTQPVTDPWCSEVTVKRESDCYWIAVKYKECKTRPVRVQPVGCGCDETQCEYSRWRDGFEIGILDHCPESHQKREGEPKLEPGMNFDAFKKLLFHDCHVPKCPPCPEEPWVALAKVHVDDNGCVCLIDNCSCRRLVLSFSDLWWKCCDGHLKITPPMNPEIFTPGTDVTVVISGENFPQTPIVRSTGPAVVKDYTIKPGGSQISATISVPDDASPGRYWIRVIDPCGGMGKWPYEIPGAAPNDRGTPEIAPADTGARRKAPTAGKRKKT